MLKRLITLFTNKKKGCLVILLGDKRTGWIPSEELAANIRKSIYKTGIVKHYHVVILPSLAVDSFKGDYGCTSRIVTKLLKGTPAKLIGVDYENKNDWRTLFSQVSKLK